MNGARQKNISWVLLAAFFTQALPLSLFARTANEILINNSLNRPSNQNIPANNPTNPRQWNWADFNAGLTDQTTGGNVSGVNAGGNTTGGSSGSGGNSTSGGRSSSGANSGVSSGGTSGATSGSSGGASNQTAVNTPPPGTNGGGGSGDTPGVDGSITKPKFYPMCLFVDKGAGKTPQQMDKEIQEMMKMSLKCNVNLVVYPRWVDLSSLPRVGSAPQQTTPRSNKINELASASCNIKEALGVPSASVSTCDSDKEVAAEMCKSIEPSGNPPVDIWKQSVAGCAQVHAANGGGASRDELDQTNRRAGQGTEQLQAFSGGGAVPSIEKLGACSAGVIAHESQGHSQMGKPNGSKYGNGIGEIRKDADGNILGPEPEGGFNGWTDAGCAVMYANSFDNSKGLYRYSPTRKAYMPREMNRVLDIPGGEKVFKKAIAGDGRRNGDTGTEPVGDAIKKAKDATNASGYSLREPGTRNKIADSGISGGHPQPKSSGGNFTGNYKSEPTVTSTASVGRVTIPPGQSDAVIKDSNARIGSNENSGGSSSVSDNAFFKNMESGGVQANGTTSPTGATTGASSNTGAAGTQGLSGTSTRTGEKGPVVFSSRDTEKSYLDPNFFNEQNKKPKASVARRGESVGRRNRLLPNEQPTPIRGVASVPSNNESAVPLAVSERRSPEPEPRAVSNNFENDRRGIGANNIEKRNPLKGSFSATSDPGLVRTKGSARRTPSMDADSPSRNSNSRDESAYGESEFSSD